MHAHPKRCRSSWQRLVLAGPVALAMVAGTSLQSQQRPPSGTSQESRPALPASPVGASDLLPAAYTHYLLALRFASDGIEYEALREVAESLRAQRNGNPAAGLAFQLIEQQRQDVHLTLCCHAGNILIAKYSPDGQRILTVYDDKTASHLGCAHRLAPVRTAAPSGRYSRRRLEF